ncbi:zeta toxin family protein [Luteipulveratus sp. YIM 133132]|uniref:Zeta toxin family protein n=1 Tax=Luteipulveratus flavus TaxID=3031728 RepID=A0ABT6C3H3_9MICO|nr:MULTISPECIES: zeta toxin family protein [unclassified Luteipulveratus]MDE9366555.1 zeta toxin family protein [Luteipulveratus sp. YIM 133132]MDF8263506.1 zeta toxin family protein [Luteipulveratus sp. YIM 133296]
MTDAHQHALEELTSASGPLTADGERSTLRNPSWWRQGPDGPEPRAGRDRLHERVLQEFRDAHPAVVQDRQAIVLAGPPGAGKSSSLDDVVRGQGSSQEQWLVINSDDFKDALLDEALRDGSYESWIKGPEVRAYEAQGHEFQPREFASLVHGESGLLAQQATRDALERGDRVVIDGTLSHQASADRLMGQLRDAGYSVTVVDVECTQAQSEQRALGRWRSGREEAATGTTRTEQDARLGGRWVPPAFARSLFQNEDGRSSCAHTVDHVEQAHGHRTVRYRLPEGEAAPRLVSDSASRTSPAGPASDVAQVRGARGSAFQQPPSAAVQRATGRPGQPPTRQTDRPGPRRDGAVER